MKRLAPLILSSWLLACPARPETKVPIDFPLGKAPCAGKLRLAGPLEKLKTVPVAVESPCAALWKQVVMRLEMPAMPMGMAPQVLTLTPQGARGEAVFSMAGAWSLALDIDDGHGASTHEFQIDVR